MKHLSPGNETGDRLSRKTVVLVSLVLLLPCFWQSRIQSIDLPSHIYNTWLASLVAQGQAPGLSIAHQSNNVLFDLMLAALFPLVGAAWAQKIAVASVVLIFFWGAIFLISGLRPRNWWFLLPSTAALAYGSIFHHGFFNFYLALGICFWYLAFFLSGGWRTRCFLIPLLALAWIAHPMPVLWAAGLALYTLIAEHLPPPGRILLLAAGAAALVEIHFVILTRFRCNWSFDQAWLATGMRQFLLFGKFYEIPCALLLMAWGVLFLRRAKMYGWRNLPFQLPFQLWLLSVIAVVAIPTAVLLPQYSAPLGFVAVRLSLAATILLCALIIDAPMKTVEKILLAAGALIFFCLIFRDARSQNRMEDQLHAALAQLPANSRVIGQLRVPSMQVGPGIHAVDRACLGHCYSYASYEPSTRQFRVRAAPGNSIVMANYADVFAVETGKYRVQAADLPLFLAYACGPNRDQVCSRELHEGEIVGQAAQAP